MVLPTDNQTEGVVITDAPPSVPTPPPPPIASGPRLMPFTPVFRERALWLVLLLSTVVFVAIYQTFPNYYIFPGPSSNSAAIFLRSAYIGEGWNEDGPSAVGMWTDGDGTVHFPNFGYAVGTGSYDLEINADLSFDKQIAAQQATTFTLSIGNTSIGSYTLGGGQFEHNIAVPASVMASDGPDPVLIVGSKTFSTADKPNRKLGIAVASVHLNAPSFFVLDIPPVFTLLVAPLFAMLCYIVRRHRSTAVKTAINSLLVTAMLSFYSSLFLRSYLQLILALLLLLVLLIALYRWRRELANWLLHLRYPDDERFRTV